MFSQRLLKRLFGAALLLGGIWVLYVWRQVPRRAQPFSKSIKEVEQISLKEGHESLVLKRMAGEWKVIGTAGQSYKADSNRVTSLISTLSAAALEDIISEKAESYPDFETTEGSGTLVTVADRNGKTLGEGLFGKQAPDFTHLYFRFPDRIPVYLLRGVIRGDLGPVRVDAWRDPNLVEVPEADMQALEVVHPAARLELKRSSDTWTEGGRLVDPTPIYPLLSAVGHLRADEWVAESTGSISMASLTFATVTLHSSKGTFQVHIGPLDKKKNRYPVAGMPENGIGWVSADRLKPVFLKPTDLKTKAK